MRRVLLLLALGALALWGAPAPAQDPPGVELTSLAANRRDGALVLDYQVRLPLTPTVEDALMRGLPIYFTAEATLRRDRWYWRDERIARVRRTWRVAYQPLTGRWRVTLAGLSRTLPSQAAALDTLTAAHGWKIVDAERLEADERYHLTFTFKLDVDQLPPPMQADIDRGWRLAVTRQIRID